jgi:hypothetical protein
VSGPVVSIRKNLFMKLFVLSLLVFTFAAADTLAGDSDSFNLSADGDVKWQKGNMHTHSLWSDGDDYPEMIATWYLEHGYQFLVYTDHNTLLNRERWIDIDKNKGGRVAYDKLTAAFTGDWVETREVEDRHEVRLKQFDEVFDRLAKPGEFLLIQGEEISDAFGRLPVHLCATNMSELLPPMHGQSITETIQNNINAAIARRERTGEKTMVHLNHPNFIYAITAEQLMQVVGERFFEVYNGHPSVHNTGDATHASTERMWDIINTFRLAQLDLPLMYGMSTDDGHSYHTKEPGKAAQPGRGWVMVLANKLDPDVLVTALEAGQFYSSSGVELSSITWKDNTLDVIVEAEDDVSYRIDFIGTRRDFDDSSRPASEDEALAAGLTRIYSDDIGAVLKSVDGTSGSYKCKGDEWYVRAVVTSSRQHPNPSEKDDLQQAWVQPIVVNDGKH